MAEGTALEPEYGDPAFNAGYQHGAAVAFGLMGMAEAIRENYCNVCRYCGDVEPWYLPICQCWNDE